MRLGCKHADCRELFFVFCSHQCFEEAHDVFENSDGHVVEDLVSTPSDEAEDELVRTSRCECAIWFERSSLLALSVAMGLRSNHRELSSSLQLH